MPQLQLFTDTLDQSQITAKIIEDSISLADVRLTTFQLSYPRFIHAEFMTHRVFSRNASSSRAIPVAKMIEQVRTNPARPIHWGKNQPGMQAKEELSKADREAAQWQWERAAQSAAFFAEQMEATGTHKQVVNRILEPFQIMHVIVTATEWDNFFALRAHPDAQPEINALAVEMARLMHVCTPKLCFAEEWHLPYVTPEERDLYNVEILKKLSAARCARVSYLTHDGKTPDVQKDVDLYDRLVGSKPIHASPVEHQATPMPNADTYSGNFKGWFQHRKEVESRML